MMTLVFFFFKKLLLFIIHYFLFYFIYFCVTRVQNFAIQKKTLIRKQLKFRMQFFEFWILMHPTQDDVVFLLF